MVCSILLEGACVAADCVGDSHIQLICDPHIRGAGFILQDSSDQDFPIR